MALLAEEVVEEWLNRQGYFTIRGIRLGTSLLIAQNSIRDAVVRKRKAIDMNRLLWRIVEERLKWSISPEEGNPEDIIGVKNLSPSFFKGTTLAELFQTSESTISRKIKQANAAQSPVCVLRTGR